jgi:hypothetical protein
VTLIPGAVGVCKHKGECEHRVEHRAEHDIEQSGTGPSVFANTKVSANIACKGKEADVNTPLQTARTTGNEISHSIDMQVAYACADARCSQMHRC